MYGMPGFSEELERDVELGKVVLGGCVVSEHDAVWECVDCGKTFGQQTEDPNS